MKQKRHFNGQVNNMLCFFGKLPSMVKSHLFSSYCMSFYGCELWDLTCDQLSDFCTAWIKSVCRVWDLPYMTHCYLLPLLDRCLPVLDEICKRSMNFVSTCLSHKSSLVSYVAHHSIRFGLNFSPTGRNVLYCSWRYGFDVSDVLTNNSRFISDSIYSCARAEVTDVQMHEVDLLLECILIRDGQASLPCWFSRSRVQTNVDYLCTVWSFVI